MLLIALLLASACAFADTTVYVVDDSSPAPKQVTNAVDNGDYIRATIPSHGFSANDKITVQGVRGCWRVNGTREVAVVVDANTVDLQPLARTGETNLDCGGTFTAANESGGAGSRQYWARKLTASTLIDPPNINGLDGLGGTFTTALQSRDTGDNPAWLAVQSVAAAPATSWNSSNWAGSVLALALAWHAEGRPSSSTYKTKAIELLGQFHTVRDTTACDDLASRPTCGYGLFKIEQDELDFANSLLAYSIMRSDMTSEQRTQFANSVLNDVGQDNDSQTNCTNLFSPASGTLTATTNSNVVSLNPASAIADVEVGDYVDFALTSTGRFADSSGRFYVTAKDDMAGTLTFNLPVTTGGTAHTWYYVEDPEIYKSTACGRIWYQKHYNVNTTSGQSGVAGGDPYPTTGGDDTSDDNNLMWWRSYVYLWAGATLCKDDVRACDLFEREQAYFMTRSGFAARSLWSGMSNGGSGHYGGRTHGPFAYIANTLKAALTPSIDLSTSPVTKSLMHRVYQLLPGQGAALHQWGEVGGGSLLPLARHDDFAMSLLSGSNNDARYYRYWMQNSWNQYTQSNLQTSGARAGGLAFMGIDWANAGLDHTALPTQHSFGFATEFDEDIFGNAMTSAGLLGAISKSCWTANCTSVGWFPLGPYRDHATITDMNNVQIFRGHWLFGNTAGSTTAPTCMTNQVHCFAASSPNNNNLEIGAPAASATSYGYVWAGLIPNTWSFNPANITNGAVAKSVRWAGDQYTGRTSSEYASLTWDAQPVYFTQSTGTVNYAQHNQVHVKKGGRDYILEYISVSVPSAKRMRRQLHYPQNGQTGEGNTTSSSRIIRTLSPAANNTSMHTQVIWPQTPTMTDFQMVRTSATNINVNPQASASYPVYLYSGSDACSYTAPSTITVTVGTTTGDLYMWVQPSDCTFHIGHNSSGVSASAGSVDGGVTACPGSDAVCLGRINVTGSGLSASWYYDPMPQTTNSTYAGRRFVVECGTVTLCEQIVLHEPHGNQTDGAVTAAPTQTADWYTVQLSHASLAAVVAFARGNETKDAWSYTSDHAGTAQYVFRGLSPGNYSFQCDADTPQLFSVNAGDETATVDSASGVCALARTGDGPPIITTSFPDGAEDEAYSQTAQGTCTASPCVWSIPVGALPTGLSLNSSTGEISGTPTESGVSNFTLRYTDNDTLYQERALSITINPAAASPLVFNPPTTITCTVGQATCSQNLGGTASGGTPPYTFSATGLPSGVTLNTDGTWTNAASAVGDFSAALTVTDDAAASVEDVPVTIRVVTASDAADFTLKRSVCSSSACLFEVTLSGLNANATVYGVLRDQSSGNEVARFQFDPGPASRSKHVEGLSAGATLTLQLVGDNYALFTSATTASTPTSSNTVRYQVSSSSVTGTTHLRLRYGSTSALGSTSSIVPCSGGACSVSLTRDSGPLWIADDRCADDACASVLASAPAQPYMVQ